jgi:UDP-N-acetylmuramoylalanine--D-glutamate ligase
VGDIGGITYVNDSKATNPQATLTALEATDGPVVLMLGGDNTKGSDFTTLLPALADRGVRIVAFGAAAAEVAEAVGADVDVVRAGRLADAVASASQSASPGDVVLLSPACASFDEFGGYEERGDAFRALVAAMGLRDG